MPADLPPAITPVTEACIIRSAESMGVPLPILAAILYVENGTPGLAMKNKNNSYDLGPIQVNTIWIDHFERRGVSKDALKNHGCVNVLAGASILRDEIRNTKDLSKGVAQYHSRQRKNQIRYLGLVNDALQKFKSGYTLKQLVNRLNRRS